MTDVELLALHRQGNDSAFADSVRRHLGWVYGVARRRLGDAHLAEDVAQAVFVILHRKSPSFASDGAMIGWLHKAAWYATESAARDERRRLKRETEAAAIRPAVAEEPDYEWRELAPVLDELIGKLARADREAILLRYFRDLSFAEVGDQMGTSAEAARKRVDRAIEKLRQLATRKGMTLSAALPALLAAHVRLIPPPGLVATSTVAATAHAGSMLAGSSGGIVKGALLMTATTKVTLVAGVVVAGVVLVATTATVTVLVSSPAKVQMVEAPANPATTVNASPNSSNTLAAMQQRCAVDQQQQPMIRLAAPPPPQVWQVSAFQAVRWPGATPQVQVQGAWYQLQAVAGVPVDQILQFIAGRAGQPVSCYQSAFENQLLVYLSEMGHNAANSGVVDLTVSDPATGNVRILRSVPETRENHTALLNTRQSQADRGATDTPMVPLIRAMDSMTTGRTDDLIDCFESLSDDQKAKLVRAAEYTQLLDKVLAEVMAKFSHDQLSAADHFFKPTWWMADLNVFEDGPDSARIDLRSIGLGFLPVHRTPAGWFIDPKWVDQNAAGMERIHGFMPTLQAFETDLNAGKFTSAADMLAAIASLKNQFDAAIGPVPTAP